MAPDPRAPDDGPAASACPGCGAVLAAAPAPRRAHPGASPECARLFETTVRGLREEAGTDPAAAATEQLADAAYDAQHPVDGDPERLRAALARLAPGTADLAPPPAWQTTVADVAADLDVIDLAVLVETWARTVAEDWAASPAAPR